MSVDSYLELFTTMYGWAFAGIIRDVLVATGIVYLPFIMLIISTWMEAHESASVEGADAGWMIRKMEVELGSAIFVLAMCFTTVSQLSLNYTPDKTTLNPAPVTVTGGASGSTYGTAFASVPGNVEVPAWWFTVMGLSSGINQAVKTGIGSNADGFRQLQELAQLASVEDPQERAQLQRFANECWIPARSMYLTSATPLSAAGAADLATYGTTDPEWIGSHVFQDEPGYYDTLAATSGVAGFVVDPTQDADVAGSALPPDNGRPSCNQWWTTLKANIVTNLTITGGATLFSKVAALIAAPAGDINDAMVRLAITKSRPNMIDPASIIGDQRAWYQKLIQASFDVPGIAAGVEQGMEAQASKFPIIQFASLTQPLILMGIYAFLPLIIVFSRYSLQVMFLGALAIFTVKFWAVMWFIARWLDDSLIKAMYPDAATLLGQALQNGADGVIKRITLNTVLVGLYVGLPLIWTGMMAWAGMKIMYGIAAMQESAIGGGVRAGQRGIDMASKALRRK
jgi:hypothetical protein